MPDAPPCATPEVRRGAVAVPTWEPRARRFARPQRRRLRHGATRRDPSYRVVYGGSIGGRRRVGRRVVAGRNEFIGRSKGVSN